MRLKSFRVTYSLEVSPNLNLMVTTTRTCGPDATFDANVDLRATSLFPEQRGRSGEIRACVSDPSGVTGQMAEDTRSRSLPRLSRRADMPRVWSARLISAFLVGEVIAAVLGHSLALFADAAHMSTDSWRSRSVLGPYAWLGDGRRSLDFRPPASEIPLGGGTVSRRSDSLPLPSRRFSGSSTLINVRGSLVPLSL